MIVDPHFAIAFDSCNDQKRTTSRPRLRDLDLPLVPALADEVMTHLVGFDAEAEGRPAGSQDRKARNEAHAEERGDGRTDAGVYWFSRKWKG